jgi:hypothetical protein
MIFAVINISLWNEIKVIEELENRWRFSSGTPPVAKRYYYGNGVA